MRKFLLAATAAGVALTVAGRALAGNETPTGTVAPPQATTTEGLVFSKDTTQAKPIQSDPAEAKPAEAKPAEAKGAEQATAPTAGAESGPVAQQLRELVEGKFNQFVTREPDRAGVLAFYKARNFAPLWVADGKPAPRAQKAADFLGKVGADGLNPEDYPVPQFSNTGPAKLAANELSMTNSVISYARHVSIGRVAFSRVSGAVYFDQKAQTPDPAAVLNKIAESSDVSATLDSFAPQHAAYKALKAQLAAARKAQFSEIDNNRGPVKAAPEVKKEAKTDEKSKRKSKSAEGDAGDDKPVSATADTIIANLERWRWMPHELGDSYVMVNVPDYTLKLVQNDKVIWQTKIVVGKPGTHATPLLTETMKFITVNPTWNVPPSIIRNEYLPALAQDPNALARVGLRITHNADGSIRIYQPPGERNALGRIRFNFPNRFLVYQHDTPDKHLFDKTARAFSHGCMRVQNPDMYAEMLLKVSQPEDGYTAARVKAMYGTSERTINFKKPIPVYITYQTVFTDDAGHRQVRADLYGLDKDTKAVLHGERRTADVPVARNYSSGSRPVASAGGTRRQASALPSYDDGWGGGAAWRQNWGGGGFFFGRRSGIW